MSSHLMVWVWWMLGEEAGAASNDSIISGDMAGGVQRARATQPVNMNQRKRTK